MRLRIQTKFVLITVTTVLLISSLTAAIAFKSFTQSYKETVSERVFAQAHGLKSLIEDVLSLGLEIGSIRGLSQECRKMVAMIPHGNYCFVMDNEGQIVYHSNLPENLRNNLKPVNHKVLGTSAPIVERWTNDLGKVFFDYSLPIRSTQETVAGYVRVGVGSEIVYREVLRLRNFYIFLTLAITAIASIFVFWLFQLEILKPIETLISGVSRIGRGDLDHPIEVRAKDQIYDLALAFNTMAANLKRITASRDDLNREIAHRQKAEEALRQERDRAQQYLDVAGVMIIALDTFGNVILVNERGCEILGFTKEELVGKNWFQYSLPQKVVPQVQGVHSRLMSGEVDLLRYFENPVLTKKGEERIILWNNSLLRDGQGQIIGVLSSGEDVTDRRNSEKLITIQKDLGVALSCIHDLKSATNLLLDAILKTEGVDCGSIYLSDDKAGILAQASYRGLDPDVAKKFDQYVPDSSESQALAQGKPFYKNFSEIESAQEAYGLQNGLRSMVIIPMLYFNQVVAVFVGGSCLFTDTPLRTRHAMESITSYFGGVVARIKAEEKLRESEGRYRELVQNANSIILRMDMDGNVTFFNEYAQRFLGFEESEIVGKSVVGTIVPQREDGGRDLKDMIERICQNPEEYALNENQNMCKDGKKVWIAWTNKAVMGEDGKQEVLCIGTDISKRKQAESQMDAIFEDLQTANEELKEAQDQILQSEKMVAIGHLSAGVAHEVKNPLAVILLGVNILMKKLSSMDHQSQEHLKMIRNAAERANRVITDLLNLSRETEVRLSVVSLQDILDDAVSLAKTVFRSRKIVFYKEYPSEEIKIMADKILLEQVFFNLFSNAADAIQEEGSVWVKAFLKKEKKASTQKLIVEVSDNGEGMSPEVLKRVFEPFFTTKEEGKGNGLGLSVSYMILQRHGAEVRAESQIGQGAKFIITFSRLL